MPDTPAPISISVSGPLAATLQEGFKFGAKICEVLLTPEGQECLKQWRTDGAAFRKGLNDGWEAFLHFLGAPHT